MDTREKNQSINMKKYIYIALLLCVVACHPNNGNNPQPPIVLDNIMTTADFRYYGDYYNSGHQVFAIDMLSDGLSYDSSYHITGSGCNLFLSDVFTTADRLPAGHYQMDSVAKDYTFLRGMDYEGSVTGCYLLLINEDKIQKIILFTSGSMDVSYVEEDIHLDFSLYTADSAAYHASYTGPATYR
jgi:hypothetical protein